MASPSPCSVTSSPPSGNHGHAMVMSWSCHGAILKLFVQASKCHRNPWKSHFLPQKVTKSTIWNGSSVKWTLVNLDFAFVNDFQFSVCPSATKMNYFELHYKWLHLVLS